MPFMGDADDREDAEGWVDGLQLCAHIASVNQLSRLRQALQRPANEQEG